MKIVYYKVSFGEFNYSPVQKILVWIEIKFWLVRVIFNIVIVIFINQWKISGGSKITKRRNIKWFGSVPYSKWLSPYYSYSYFYFSTD